ncbi:MAG TPA: hypothetical protein VMR86_12300 [Myxococcota bacterium]|nr:hypothetical protein [Myxococcota bacterium]
MSRLHSRRPATDAPSVAGGMVKGVAVLGLVKHLRSRRDEVLPHLRPELQHYLSDTLSVSGWYPETDHAELLRAGAHLYAMPPERALERMGELAARSHSEIYRELLVGHGSQSRTFALWSTQHDTGELRRVREGSTRMSFELTDFAGVSHEFCLSFTGYLRGTFLVNGYSDVTVDKVSCTLRNDPSCLWRCSWKREARGEPGG